jgi:hypothetical protein
VPRRLSLPQNFIHSSKLGDSGRSLGGKSLKPGDELRLRIDPLRSGAPGGPIRKKTDFLSGELVVTH